VIPLNRLLLKNASFVLTEIEQEAFESLRDRLKNAPFMQYLNNMGLFTLETDDLPNLWVTFFTNLDQMKRMR